MTTHARGRWLAINFAATIFVSAFLLFQVQPLVSKYILPWFGGSPAVWTTCMLFFQTLLFGGYTYAHLSQRWLRPKQQALVHLALIVVALLMLRVVPSESWKPEDSSHPAGRILLLLGASVGLPYFVLSSTAPLIQAWFARSFPGRIPYRLYALSNFGSLLALLSYPFLFERLFDIKDQATFWSFGFVAYAALCGYAAVSLWMVFRGADSEVDVGPMNVADQPESLGAAVELVADSNGSFSVIVHPNWLHVVLWVALPALASVTLLATTSHVSTDVAPVPFLWVVPLSLYLVTFIIAFDHSRWYQPALFAIFTLLAIYVVAAIYYTGIQEIDLFQCGTPGRFMHWVQNVWAHWHHTKELKMTDGPELSLGFMKYAAMNFAAMFGICMLCHGELVRMRPDPKHLTAYYLMISAGGALGGVAVTLIAPQVFSDYLEFKLALYAGYLLAVVLLVRSVYQFAACERRGTTRLWSGIHPLLGLPLLLIAGVGLYDLWHPQKDSDKSYFDDSNPDRVVAVRSFFGTLSVSEYNKGDIDAHHFTLKHGSITHGTQYPADPREPTTYYARESGVGLTIAFFKRDPDRHLKIGAVGLGTGTVAAYIDKGERINFYEINPKVIEITEPGQLFTYLRDCKEEGGSYEIRLGDARLTLEREAKNNQPQHYDVLILDAFSGDAIPMHLLTEEAFNIYMQHLASEADGGPGAIAVHISNRYLDLEPVVRGAAVRFHLRQVRIENPANPSTGAYRSDWIILTQNNKLADALETEAEPEPASPRSILWTDGRSNMFDVLK